MIDSEIDVGQDYIEPEVLAELAFDLGLSSFSGDQSVSSQSHKNSNITWTTLRLVWFVFFLRGDAPLRLKLTSLIFVS